MARDDVQVNFRMPQTLKAALERAARDNKRSITAELVARLEASFEPGIAINDERLFPVFNQWLQWLQQAGWRPPDTKGSFLERLVGDERRKPNPGD